MLRAMRSSAKYIWIVAIAIPFVAVFLFYQTSGLAGRGPTTASTPVASVNGREIPYSEWARATQQRETEASRRLGRPLTLDERRQVEQDTFDELVTNILLSQELARRNIVVSDAEIIEAARTSPPPDLMNEPQLQTDGHFDPAKYLRLLSSPMAKQQGLLVQLEGVYRDQIPREKLFEQVATGVYATDGLLWNLWRDTHDTAVISFVRFVPDSAAQPPAGATDAEVQAYYDSHKDELTRKGRAVVSLLVMPRTISRVDTAATLRHLEALRQQIASGAKFEDVAKRESSDSASAVNGGDLGWSRRNRFVPQFESAAWALKPGELSAPVLSPFGYHLIKMDERQGDSARFRHILLRIQQSDSAAARVNARADSLEHLGGQAESPAQFDRAAHALALTPIAQPVAEGSPVFWGGRQVPSVGAWAFSGAKPGESSELFEAEDGYYLARLDSLSPGGLPTLQAATSEIRRLLARQKALDAVIPRARQFAAAATASSLERAAQDTRVSVVKSPPFTPTSFVPDVGQMNEAVGAAFTLPVGAMSEPVKTTNAVYVLRVDRRVPADSAVWVKQKDTQRPTVLRNLRRQRVEEFLADLRQVAKITDKRKTIEAANRRSTT